MPIHIEVFEFNPFAENTYVVYDDTRACVIIDPGCFYPEEKRALRNYIADNALNPVRLLLTHAHLDHIFGNKFVHDTWGLLPECHEGELPLLRRAPEIAAMYGVSNMEASPEPTVFIRPGEEVTFGESRFSVLFTPGHSPASVCFYNEEEGVVIAGDVLFYESIGRTDLPGGDMHTLLTSIRSQLFTLPGETVVLPGHGPGTTIRHEKEYNPFL